MQVRVLFFGQLKEVAGEPAQTLTLPEGATLGDLLSHYERKLPRLRDFYPAMACSINQEFADAQSPLHHRDEVALLPPVSGGKDGSTPGAPGPVRCSIVFEPIQVQAITDALKRPEDGAIAAFEGIVRNQTRGRRTLYLDYEAYEPMALRQMEALAQQALERFQVRDVAIVHRLGRLEIGETSVLIVVASAHRDAAFDACRWLIDTLKRTVPVWKKEYFEGGAVWADGEPFPATLALDQPKLARD